VSDVYTAEQLAMLEAQVAHFASDDHIRAEVAVWRDATPAERLAEVARMCKVADHVLENLEPAQLERVMTREPLPPESLAILAAIRQLPR
jgi:hypothetical protein